MNNHNLREAVEVFLAGIAGEVSESTREWYGRCLESFVSFLGPDYPLGDVSPGNVRLYRAHLIDRDMSIHSVHGRQRAVRRLFSWLLEEGLVDRNVALDVPLVRIPPQPPKALADDDMIRLLERLPAGAPTAVSDLPASR